MMWPISQCRNNTDWPPEEGLHHFATFVDPTFSRCRLRSCFQPYTRSLPKKQAFQTKHEGRVIQPLFPNMIFLSQIWFVIFSKHVYFVPKYDSGRKGWKGRLSSTKKPQKQRLDGESTFSYCTKLGPPWVKFEWQLPRNRRFREYIRPWYRHRFIWRCTISPVLRDSQRKGWETFCKQKSLRDHRFGTKQFRIPIINFGVNHFWASQIAAFFFEGGFCHASSKAWNCSIFGTPQVSQVRPLECWLGTPLGANLTSIKTAKIHLL